MDRQKCVNNQTEREDVDNTPKMEEERIGKELGNLKIIGKIGKLQKKIINFIVKIVLYWISDDRKFVFFG